MLRHPSRETLRRAAVAGALVFGTAAPAHAYIDPGTGSMLLQVIGASVAGAMFYFRDLRMKLFSLFGRRGPGSSTDGTGSPSSDSPR